MSESLKSTTESKESLKTMSSKESVEYIERLFPEVEFDRFENGEVIDWGIYPVQVVGRISGNPFYFKMRNGYSELEVWPETIPLDNVPLRFIDPILSAYGEYNYESIEEAPRRSCEEFINLLNNLEEPSETYSARMADYAKDNSLPTGRVIGELIEKAYPNLTMIHRDGLKDDGLDVILEDENGFSFNFDWTMTTLMCRVYPPDSTPLIGDPFVLSFSDRLDDEIDENEIMTSIVAISSNSVNIFKYQTNYFNFVAAKSLKERKLWLKNVIDSYDAVSQVFSIPPLSSTERKTIEAYSEKGDLDLIREIIDN